MIVYIEDEVVAQFTSNMIIDDFDIINTRSRSSNVKIYIFVRQYFVFQRS